MTHDEILTGLYDRTLVGDKPAVLELTEQGLEDGMDPSLSGGDGIPRFDRAAGKH